MFFLDLAPRFPIYAHNKAIFGLEKLFLFLEGAHYSDHTGFAFAEGDRSTSIARHDEHPKNDRDHPGRFQL
jgi:hypothetical protein